MEIATFKTLNEANNILNILNTHPAVSQNRYQVGGVTLTPRSKTDWYWITTGNLVFYELPFSPGEPDDRWGMEFCLEIYRSQANISFGFNDCVCDNYPKAPDPEASFICQKIW